MHDNYLFCPDYIAIHLRHGAPGEARVAQALVSIGKRRVRTAEVYRKVRSQTSWVRDVGSVREALLALAARGWITYVGTGKPDGAVGRPSQVWELNEQLLNLGGVRWLPTPTR